MRVLAAVALCLSLVAVPAAAAELEVPLEIGIGPVTHTWFGPVAKDQALHGGLVITTDIVLDRAWLQDNKGRIPARWRSLAGSVDEVRIKPVIFIPDTLIISPRVRNTGMVGASWRPVAVGVPLLTSPVRIGVDAGLRLTTAIVWSDSLPSEADPKTTFFLRPGVDLSADVVFPLSETVRVRLGADAHAYVPQKVGAFGLGQAGERMWLLARGFLELRVRVPITVER
jgi:hypothetical protein